MPQLSGNQGDSKEAKKPRGKPRAGAALDNPRPEPLAGSPITFRPTQRQADYFACAATLKPAQIIRSALDNWIDETRPL